MRLVALSVIAFICLAPVPAQPPATAEVQLSLQQFREAARAGHLVEASEVASKLNQEVQRQYRATLVADASKRVTDVLSWLPTDTESFFFLQSPFTVQAKFAPDLPEANQIRLLPQPSQVYAFDRLVALNKGRFFRALDGITIRIAAAGMSNRKPRSHGMTPALMPSADVTYFYFLDQPANSGIFGAPDDVLSAHAVWKGEAPIRKADHGSETIPDNTFLSFAKPDLLIVSSKRELLLQVLDRVANAGVNRALPPSLPEWKHIDQHAAFWGLRHFVDPSTRNPEDTQAEGVALNSDSEQLRIYYLTGAQSLARLLPGHGTGGATVDRLEGEGWLIRATLTDRGDFPFHLGMGLLGFGMYR